MPCTSSGHTRFILVRWGSPKTNLTSTKKADRNTFFSSRIQSVVARQPYGHVWEQCYVWRIVLVQLSGAPKLTKLRRFGFAHMCIIDLSRLNLKNDGTSRRRWRKMEYYQKCQLSNTSHTSQERSAVRSLDLDQVGDLQD